jgi:hypothetical protein
VNAAAGGDGTGAAAGEGKANKDADDTALKPPEGEGQQQQQQGKEEQQQQEDKGDTGEQQQQQAKRQKLGEELAGGAAAAEAPEGKVRVAAAQLTATTVCSLRCTNCCSAALHAVVYCNVDVQTCSWPSTPMVGCFPCCSQFGLQHASESCVGTQSELHHAGLEAQQKGSSGNCCSKQTGDI